MSAQVPPPRTQIRQLISAVLITDSELNAFCIDHFPKIYSQFSDSMNRTQKENLMISNIPIFELADSLKVYIENSQGRSNAANIMIDRIKQVISSHEQNQEAPAENKHSHDTLQSEIPSGKRLGPLYGLLAMMSIVLAIWFSLHGIKTNRNGVTIVDMSQNRTLDMMQIRSSLIMLNFDSRPPGAHVYLKESYGEESLGITPLHRYVARPQSNILRIRAVWTNGKEKTVSMPVRTDTVVATTSVDSP